tara:strand:- start:3529 stop:4656 length:1128 start_codon:yes stop_codon:yes gene_type:complete
MTNKKYLISIIIGTRPEAIKFAPIINKLQLINELNVRVILTGQHKEMVIDVIDLFDIKYDLNIDLMHQKQSLTHITCSSLKKLDEEYSKNKPDLVLVQGDTSSAFAGALAAFYKKIPVFHVEAGLRTDNLFSPYPEEANRRLISQIASINFAPTIVAKENLLKSNVSGHIYVTGNTVVDSLLYISKNKQAKLPYGPKWNSEKVIFVTVHRRENWGNNIKNICSGLKKILLQNTNVSLIIPMHKNPKVRNELKNLLENTPRAFLIEPLKYDQLISVLKNCYLILTDSGGLQEEAPSLNIPVLVLRDTTERPEAIKNGSAKLIGTNSKIIIQETQKLLDDKSIYNSMKETKNPFGDGKASDRIIKICIEYLNEIVKS